MADETQDRDAVATNVALYRDGIGEAELSRDAGLQLRDLERRIERERAEKEQAETLSGYLDKGYIYRTASDKQWRWKRVAPNNEIVGASHEGYTSFSNCVKNFERQFAHCKIADVTVEE